MPFIVENHVIRRKFAEGGMSEVYLAESAGRQVAIKALHTRLLKDRSAKKRMRREGALHARVPEHQNIVRCMETGETDGRPYLVLEYYKSEPLRRQIRNRRRMSTQDIGWYGFQIAGALAAIHSAGVVHLDVKPENILISPRERAKLIDFGICTEISSGRKLWPFGKTKPEGSPSYMSPEQITGGRMDGRADIYSLGCVLYEMACGRPPYTADDANKLLNLHVSANSQPKPIRDVNPAIPAGLDQLIRRCLAAEPAGRPPHAEYLAGELQPYAFAAEEDVEVDEAV